MRTEVEPARAGDRTIARVAVGLVVLWCGVALLPALQQLVSHEYSVYAIRSSLRGGHLSPGPPLGFSALPALSLLDMLLLVQVLPAGLALGLVALLGGPRRSPSRALGFAALVVGGVVVPSVRAAVASGPEDFGSLSYVPSAWLLLSVLVPVVVGAGTWLLLLPRRAT